MNVDLPLGLQASLLNLKARAKSSWFFEFKQYHSKKDFLGTKKHTRLKARTPFINYPFSFIKQKLNFNKFKIYDSNKLFTEQLSKVKTKQEFLKKTQLSQFEPFRFTDNSVNKNSFEIGIKSGWVYFPRNQTDILSYHKQILKPGLTFTDNIDFDQHITYVECVSIPFFLSDNFKSYFNPFQVKEKNLALKLKLNSKKLINDFSTLFLKTNINSSVFSNTK